MACKSLLFILVAVHLTHVYCNMHHGLIMKTGGKDRKKGDMIVMGHGKCSSPTILKSGGKKGGDTVIMGGHHECEEPKQQQPHFIPMPYPVKEPYPVPVRVPVTERVPYPVPIRVREPMPYPVQVPVREAVPYPVQVQVPVREQVPYPVPFPVRESVPYPMPIPMAQPSTSHYHHNQYDHYHNHHSHQMAYNDNRHYLPESRYNSGSNSDYVGPGSYGGVAGSSTRRPSTGYASALNSGNYNPYDRSSSAAGASDYY